jgi:hypothetical protein
VRAPTIPRRPAVLALALLLGACGVGVRPTLAAPGALGGEAGTPTGVPAADAVLGALEKEGSPELTAAYTITTRFGNQTTQAEVVRSGDRLSVTIGDVRFLTDGDTRTCRLSTGECADGLQEAWVSDTAVTSSFYAAAPARMLRVSLSRREGDPSASSTVVAGRPTTCVTVPVGGGEERTCATAEGVLAKLENASVDVELTELSTQADPKGFETTR